MSHFKEFLFETTVPGLTQQTMERIAYQCDPFLHSINYNFIEYPLFRGSVRDLNSSFKYSVRKNRKPKDMGVEMQTFIDDYFQDHTGVRHRTQSLFCAGDYNFAVNYSYTNTMMILPVGRFKFLWAENSEFRDLFEALDSHSKDIAATAMGMDYANWHSAIHNDEKIREKFFATVLNLHQHPSKYSRELHNALDKANWQTNNIIAASRSKNEIMIHCDYYYGIPVSPERDHREGKDPDLNLTSHADEFQAYLNKIRYRSR